MVFQLCFLSPKLMQFKPSNTRNFEHNIAIRSEAIAIRLEAIANRLEAITIRLEAIASRLEAIAIWLEVGGHC